MTAGCCPNAKLRAEMLLMNRPEGLGGRFLAERRELRSWWQVGGRRGGERERGGGEEGCGSGGTREMLEFNV